MVPGLGVVKALHGILNSSQFLLNNNNKGRRSNVNKHELVYGESIIKIANNNTNYKQTSRGGGQDNLEFY